MCLKQKQHSYALSLIHVIWNTHTGKSATTTILIPPTDRVTVHTSGHRVVPCGDRHLGCGSFPFYPSHSVLPTHSGKSSSTRKVSARISGMIWTSTYRHWAGWVTLFTLQWRTIRATHRQTNKLTKPAFPKLVPWRNPLINFNDEEPPPTKN
jgi:hypothetical protein